MKEWKCVQVKYHKDVGKTIEDCVGKTIEEWQRSGWRLHTYQTVGTGTAFQFYHYLLFERGEWVGQAIVKEKEKEEDEAFKILRIRYDKGEITKEEYEEMKKILNE